MADDRSWAQEDASLRPMPTHRVSPVSAFAGYLAFTLFFGAAWNDATEEQRAALRAKIAPLLEESKDESASPARGRQLTAMILVETQRIMGDEWKPQGDWSTQIDKLLP
jgi:hypothetical protein